MSIYATLWTLKFPSYGDDYIGCDWVEVMAQGVPEHVGRQADRSGDEGDSLVSFLPTTGWEEPSDFEGRLRAVVFVVPNTKKGLAGHHPQEYVDPLLILSGAEYRSIPFTELHARLCDALRGVRPRIIGQHVFNGQARVLFDDGSKRDVHWIGQSLNAQESTPMARRGLGGDSGSIRPTHALQAARRFSGRDVDWSTFMCEPRVLRSRLRASRCRWQRPG